jgi:hypothetical protein
MVAERYDAGCDNAGERRAAPAATRIRMSETTHANDEIHGAHSGDAPHDATPGDGAHADAAHGDHALGAPLGPVDWLAWGAGLLGIAAGLVIAVCLYFSTHF